MHDGKAAVVWEPGELTIERVSLADPKRGELLVDLHASGVCRTDYHFYAGESNVPMPVVLGHEGAGVVEAVGPGVSGIEPGDKVVLFLLPPCGQCEYCQNGRPFLCPSALDVRFSGTLLDGTRRLHCEGQELNHFYAQSSFATSAVVPAASAVAVRDDAPSETIACLGCGAATGIGAVLNTAQVGTGDAVAVFGCGGTGTSAVLAADAIDAGEIVAVDVGGETLDQVESLGATTTVDASESDPVEQIHEVAPDGVDYAFEFVGNDDLVRQQSIRAVKPGGTVVFSGAATADASVDVAGVIDAGKSVVGNVAGSVRPGIDIPRWVDMYVDGGLDLDELVTPGYDLRQIEDAFADLIDGHVSKPVVDCR